MPHDNFVLCENKITRSSNALVSLRLLRLGDVHQRRTVEGQREQRAFNRGGLLATPQIIISVLGFAKEQFFQSLPTSSVTKSQRTKKSPTGCKINLRKKISCHTVSFGINDEPLDSRSLVDCDAN